MAEHFVLWEFHVAPGRQEEFERHYGTDGTWVRLFREASGYLGSTLLQDRSNPLRYVTVDRWQSADAYKTFREAFEARYRALDRLCEALTVRETPIGEFRDS